MDNLVNQLVIITVAGIDSNQIIQDLTSKGFQATLVDSSGGFLEESKTTLFVGLNSARQPDLLAYLRENCQRRLQMVPTHIEGPPAQIQTLMVEAETGGATIFSLDVSHFEQIE